MKRLKPNILLYVMDVQRYDNLSCYSYYKKTSPNIDEIAKDGTLFLNNVSPAVWTLPSHASLSTGRYVSGHGVGARYIDRPQEKFTLAEVLKSAGHKTVFSCNAPHRYARWGIDDERGFDYSLLAYIHGKEHREDDPKGSLRKSRLIIDWLDRHGKESPFFIFVNSTEPHNRYWPPQPFRKQFLPGGVDDEEARETHWDPRLYRMGRQKLTRRDWEIQKALYDGETATLDHRMGLIFNYLRERDLMDDTIVVITSDHGDLQGEHDPHIEHQLHLYEPGIHVPLIIRYPRIFPEGLKVENLVQTLDIFPTLMEILGITNKQIWNQLQGHSLLSALTEEPKRTFVISEHQKNLLLLLQFALTDPNYNFRRWNNSLKVYRTPHWKYIWASNGMDELYNLKEDPLEQKNLLSEMPEKTAEMENALTGFLGSIEHRDLGDYVPPRARPRERVLKRLKLLGMYRDNLTLSRKWKEHHGYLDKK